MDKKLQKFLDDNKIKYQLEVHRKVYTAYDEAETLASHSKNKKTKKNTAKEVAKTVLLNADKNLVLVLIPSSKNVDVAKIKKKLGAKKVSLAKEADITNKLKTKIGLIHAFPKVYKLETVLVDNSVMKQKRIITSAGSYTESLIIAPVQYKKAVQEIISGSFSKAK